MAKVVVKKIGEEDSSRYIWRTWGVYVNGELIEGGFFNRGCAMETAAELKRALDRGEV